MIAAVIAYGYQLSPMGRMLRATREDPAAAQAAGIDVHRQRLWAFGLSGALSGFAGGLLVHETGTLTTEQVYLDLTFLTLAMLVIGGTYSLWGAVVGALFVSGLNSLLGDAEDGLHVGVTIDLPHGTRVIVLGAVMSLMLLLRPLGITGGREFSLAWVGRLRRKEVRSMKVCVVGCGAVGSLFAANLANLDGVEVWAYDLDRVACRCYQRERTAIDRRRRSSGPAPCDDRRLRAAGMRVRHRRDEGHAHPVGDHGDGARIRRGMPSRRSRTVSATRRRSRRTFHG